MAVDFYKTLVAAGKPHDAAYKVDRALHEVLDYLRPVMLRREMPWPELHIFEAFTELGTPPDMANRLEGEFQKLLWDLREEGWEHRLRSR